eukprot:CAMPEP_0180561228 /NCGR_PEP_ID=MMETSP1037_2-20121125/3265_1 /TAXON_ID=632150 /ORGANISM="Azadinium spinosum, Strain 3D9" /LENGTH=33 /DNA_ID= /DNA_START= /DNA_END= /DNA_ORIENTATION=
MSFCHHSEADEEPIQRPEMSEEASVSNFHRSSS